MMNRAARNKERHEMQRKHLELLKCPQHVMTHYAAISPAVPGGTHARLDLLPEDARLHSNFYISIHRSIVMSVD